MATHSYGNEIYSAARSGTKSRLRKESLSGWGFASPSVFIVLGLSFIPMAWALYLSLTDSNLLSSGSFIGLANYQALMKDPMLRKAFVNTLILAAIYLPSGLIGGLLVAMMLNQKIKGIGIYRTFFLVPFVASAAAEGLLMSFIFDPDFGIANSVLGAVGIGHQSFLSDPSQALVILAIIFFWTQFGFNVVIYLAALQDVPSEVMEAASIDGAGAWGRFWHVIFPAIRSVTVFLVVWGLIDTLQFFDLVFTTTKGGPLDSTVTIVYYIWQLAFNFFTAGYGAAVAYALFIVSLLAIVVGLVFARKRGVLL